MKVSPERRIPGFRAVLLLALALPVAGRLAGQLPPDTSARIDAVVEQEIAARGAPSASIAVVRDGRIAYVHAYGKARLDAAVPARPEMRYSIGSVSKQFLAGAILLLVQDGKLSLDDKVGRYLPDLTRADEVIIRQVLSYTSAYQDYYPLDYVAPFMKQPVTADEILGKSTAYRVVNILRLPRRTENWRSI
jgi:D-alanyl-D-alanine carboxypeptidase